MLESLLSAIAKAPSVPKHKQTTAAEIYKRIFPHRYCDDEHPLGRNSIMMLLFDSAISVKNWPDVAVKKISIANDPYKTAIENTQQQFEILFDKLFDDYSAKLIDEGILKSYDYIVKQSPLIDTTKLFPPDYVTDKTDSSEISDIDYRAHPTMIIPDDIISLIRQRGWHSFIPCFKESTLRINRMRYLHIEIIRVSEANRSITLKVTDYCGKLNDTWMIFSSVIATLKFNGNEMVIDVDPNDIMPYETILTKYLDSMPWTTKEFTFWQDVMGLYDESKKVACDIQLSGQSLDWDDAPLLPESKFTVLMPDSTYIKKLKDLLSFLSISVTVSDILTIEETEEKIHSAAMASLLHKTLKLVSAINYELWQNPCVLTSDKPDRNGRLTKSCGNLRIQSEYDPTLSH